MKTKKIFLTLATVFVLLIAMAMFVSATEFSADFGEITTFDGMSDKNLLDTTSRVVLDNGDGTYTTYPSYYIIKNQGSLSLDFTELNTISGKSYDGNSIILIELPNGITSVNTGIFGRNNGNGSNTAQKVEKVVLPESMSTVSSQSFRACQSLKSVTLGKNITLIQDWSFCNSEALEEVIIPEGSKLQELKRGFANCSSLATINFENATELTKLDGSTFASCTSLKVLDFSKSKLTTYTGQYILQNSSVETVIFPETFTDLSNQFFFDSVSTIKTIVFLGKMTNVNLQYFANSPEATIYFAKNSSSDLVGRFAQTKIEGNALLFLNDVNSYTEKEEGTLTITENNGMSNWNSSGKHYGDNYYYMNKDLHKYVFHGDEKVVHQVRSWNVASNWVVTYGLFDVEEGKAYDTQSGTENMTFTFHPKTLAPEVTAPTCTENKKLTYYCICCGKELETVEAPGTALGHDWEVTKTIDATCDTAKTVNYVCNRCNETKSETEGSALGHDFAGGSVTAIVYEDFTLNGTKTTKCSRCDATEEETLNPIFKVLGYSKSETDEVIGLKAGYSVDFDALKVYEDFNNVTVEYGMKLANTKYASEISNDASENVFNVDLTESDYNRFNTTIVGFKDTDAHKNLSLIMLAYAKCDGKVQYIQAETSSGEVDGFKTITIATVEESLVEAQPAAVVTKED